MGSGRAQQLQEAGLVCRIKSPHNFIRVLDLDLAATEAGRHVVKDTSPTSILRIELIIDGVNEIFIIFIKECTETKIGQAGVNGRQWRALYPSQVNLLAVAALSNAPVTVGPGVVLLLALVPSQ